MSRFYAQPSLTRLIPGQSAFLRCKIVTPFNQPFTKETGWLIQLVDRQGNPVSPTHYFVPKAAPVSVAEAMKALTGK